MAQRMFSLSKWTYLAEGSSIRYVNPRGRPVAIEVNSADEVSFYVIQSEEDIAENPAIIADEAAGRVKADAQRLYDFRSALNSSPDSAPQRESVDGKAVTFLALVKGRDRLEFSVDGEFDLMVEGGFANVYTVDSADVATRVIDPVIYTRIANRRQRNPELEWMMYQQRRNQETMFARLQRDTDRRLAEMEKGIKRQYAEQRKASLPAARAAKAGILKKEEPVVGSDADAGKAGKAKEAGGKTEPRVKVRSPALDNSEGED